MFLGETHSNVLGGVSKNKYINFKKKNPIIKNLVFWMLISKQIVRRMNTEKKGLIVVFQPDPLYY